jgi:DNA-binding MarR family transcriptional regulator
MATDMTTKKQAARSLAGNQDQAAGRIDSADGASDSIIAASQNERKFSFRWGIAILDAAQQFTPIYDFLLKNYAKLGVTRQEFLAIVHLASYHYETARGQSAPSLRTVADEMGYSDRRSVQKLIKSLEAKGMVRVHRAQRGKPSVYDLSPFAEACLNLWQEHLEEATTESTGELELRGELEFTPTCEPPFTPPVNSSSPETEEINRRREQQQHAPGGADVVVTSFSQKKEERLLPADSDAAFKHLRALGMIEDVARKLSVNNSPRQVITVARAARDKDSPAGWARRALEEGWDVQDPDKANEDTLREKAKRCAQGRGDACPIFGVGMRLPECAFCRLALEVRCGD